MNKTEARDVVTLLRWITRTGDTATDNALQAAHDLAHRARKTLGDGPTTTEIETHWPEFPDHPPLHLLYRIRDEITRRLEDVGLISGRREIRETGDVLTDSLHEAWPDLLREIE